MPNENGAAAADAAQQAGATADAGAQQGQSQPAGGSGRTYTAEELDAHTDRVVKERIDKQNAKHARELAAKDATIQEMGAQLADIEERVRGFEAQAARSDLLARVSAETGVPEAQLSLLKGESAEELTAAAEAFKASMPALYPSVDETGEAGTPPLSKEDIKAIRNKEERIAAMGRNKELFR